MEIITETLVNLLNQTGFMTLSYKNFIMVAVALFFLYLAIKKGYEPLLLVPISFGMLLVNLFPDIMMTVEEAKASGSQAAGLLHYFYLLDEWSILPSLIFMGVGAMTDFGPLIANPKSFLLGAAAQLGIFSAYFLAIILGFNGMAAAAISIIGGADGPTSIFLAGKLGQTELMGPIAVAAYSYMSLVPIIQPGKPEIAVGKILLAVGGKTAHQRITQRLGSVRDRVRLIRRVLGAGRVAKKRRERIAERAAVARNAKARSVRRDLQILAQNPPSGNPSVVGRLHRGDAPNRLHDLKAAPSGVLSAVPEVG